MDEQWKWVGRFLIFWGWGTPTISFYKKDLETRIWEIRLTLRNVIKIGYSAAFIFIVIVAIIGEIWR